MNVIEFFHCRIRKRNGYILQMNLLFVIQILCFVIRGFRTHQCCHIGLHFGCVPMVPTLPTIAIGTGGSLIEDAGYFRKILPLKWYFDFLGSLNWFKGTFQVDFGLPKLQNSYWSRLYFYTKRNFPPFAPLVFSNCPSRLPF